MKKLRHLIIIFLILCFSPGLVLAKGNISVSLADLNITKGKNASFTITANNSAGRVDITSDNTKIAIVSTSSVFLDMESSKITVTGKSVGRTKLKIFVADATTYDDEDLTGKTYTINVNVTEPSSNNNIKDITVEDYDLIKLDNNNYKLSVSNSVTNININATVEDPKATISGTGLHKLDIGKNNIEIIVTSESGMQNKINIVVTRKEGRYIEDLNALLNNKDEKEIDIIISDNTKISQEQLTKIKESNKVLTFNYYDNNKNLVYNWTIDGTKIDSVDEFLTSISFDNEYRSEISEITASAEGKYINFKHTGKIPEGTKIKVYVGDKFTDGELLKAYNYNKEKNELKLVKDNLEVKTGYIEFEVDNSTDYFVTMWDVNIIPEKDLSISNIILVITLIIILLVVVVFFIIKKKKGSTKENNDNNIYKDNNQNIIRPNIND